MRQYNITYWQRQFLASTPICWIVAQGLQRCFQWEKDGCQSLRSSFAGFLMVFLTFLPFSLWEVTGWASPAVEAVIAFLFLGIENIGAPEP